MPRPIVYASQIELPINADHEKSPIRHCELVAHINSEKHIQSDGLPNQLLVMTAAGPRMMTPKVTCSGVDELRYSCDCRIVFDDLPVADFQYTVLKNNVEIVSDTGTLNQPRFVLNFGSTNDFFRFIPVKVHDYDLSQLTYGIIDNTAGSMIGVRQLVGGKMVFDFSLDRIGKHFNDAIAVGILGKPYYYISIQGI